MKIRLDSLVPEKDVSFRTALEQATGYIIEKERLYLMKDGAVLMYFFSK